MAKSTQAYLNIVQIRDDTLVLKDGSLRSVILVSSVNFALKSEEEQQALIAAYVTMLNTLEYPLQILIQSRKMNVDDYLSELEEKARAQTNELLKTQIKDYLGFVKELITLGNIMSKKFYIMVPYSPEGEERKGYFKRFFGLFVPETVIHLREERFRKHKIVLEKRIDNVMAGLNGLSLRSVRLDTGALIELFYTTYNPDISESQRLGDLNDLQVEEDDY